jgi:hypothetical protein
MVLGGISSAFHPIKACVDPFRAQWLITGSGCGHVYVYNLSSVASSADDVLLPDQCMKQGSGRSPVYSVSWNPRFHMVATASMGEDGQIKILCGSAVPSCRYGIFFQNLT